MTPFLTAASNLPFTVALGLMLVLVLVELVGFLAGVGLSDWLHGHVPDLTDADGAEVAGESFAGRFIGWLGIGRVPALIVLAVFLTCFGLLGLTLQAFAVALTGGLLSAFLAAPLAFIAALPCVRIGSLLLGRVLPRDETQVASRRSLVGHVATIVLGQARAGSPAQAKVRDDAGQMQYVMVEPDSIDDAFGPGDAVLLVAQHGAGFRARRADPALLLNSDSLLS